KTNREVSISAHCADEQIVRTFNRDPATGIVGGLTLQIGVVRLVPAHDFVGQVVENKVTAISANGEDRMSFAVRLANNGYQKIGERNASLLQFALLQQHVILTVANGGRIGPIFLNA